MVKLLYQQDSYLKEFDARIINVIENKVFLDKTAFHPGPSGGLDCDKGWLILSNNKRIRVESVTEENDNIAHVVKESNPKLKVNEKIHGIIDWNRRYRMMRLHTASHILISILYKKYNTKVTGGHITPEVARDDLDLSNVPNWKDAVKSAVEETNKIASKCLKVKIYWLPREEAFKIPGIVKLANKFPPNVEKIRIVEIPGVDIQADGAPHVKNTCEIGKIEIIKMESKGARRKRVYYSLED